MRDRPVGIGVDRLQEVVRTALGEPGAVLGHWSAVTLKGGPDALDRTRSVFVLRGEARAGARALSWRVVLKVLARTDDQDDPAAMTWWERERALYDSGLLDDLAGAVRAPRCYGRDAPEDGIVWLWMEYVEQEGEPAWDSARWATAARSLGRFNGAYLAGRPPPRAEWLGGGRLRSWLERHRSRIAQIAAAPDEPAVRRWWPRPVVDAMMRLWEERGAFCDALERLPQSLGHGDAIRRNLLMRGGAYGPEELVAIDWEYAGLYAAGEEIGQTLSTASAFFDVEPDDLPALDETLFEGYLAGLRDAGWRGDPQPVRLAYIAHAALRNAFNAVGASVPDEAQRARARHTYGHSWEELAERRAELRPILLQWADEARDLLAAV